MKRAGFSLIEVNMAVFVLAIGILSMAVLYPLGLRESMQSQADLKQSMFADYILNVAVAAASSTNISWKTEWSPWSATYDFTGSDAGAEINIGDSVPDFVKTVVENAVSQYNTTQLAGFKHTRNQTYAIYCVLAQAPSRRIMGILVRSLDMDTSKMSTREKIMRLEKQPTYYAEAIFQGFADK